MSEIICIQYIRTIPEPAPTQLPIQKALVSRFSAFNELICLLLKTMSKGTASGSASQDEKNSL